MPVQETTEGDGVKTALPAREPAPPSGGDRGGPEQGTTDPESRGQARAAAWIFVGFVLVSVVVLVLLGRYFWFHGDEWNYLVDRNGGNLSDLLSARNEHLSLIPIASFRILFNTFGLRTYLPYQFPVIVLHLVAAVLLWIIIRRTRVNPWIAAAAASAFVLFGTGEETIFWAAQIGQGGTIAFGLGQLVVADHDGPIDWRDWIALGLGFLAFLCSGFAMFTVFIVGVVVLVRRGLRPALLQTVPIGVAFLVWTAAFGPDRVTDPFHQATSWPKIFEFVWQGLVKSFESLAWGSTGLAAVLAILLAVGFTLAVRRVPPSERLRRMITPIIMLASTLAFLLVSGYGRWWLGPAAGGTSRYVYVVVAFMLPALALAFDALAGYWKYGFVIATAVLVSTIPYGLSQFQSDPLYTEAYFNYRQDLIASLARSKYITQVPRSTRPDIAWSSVTAGWLLDGLRDGRLPKPTRRTGPEDPSFRLRYGLAVIDAPIPKGTTCKVIHGPVDVSLRKGDELGVAVGPWKKPRTGWYFTQQYTMQLLEDGKPVGPPISAHPSQGHLLRAQLDDLDVRIGLFPGNTAVILCR